MWSKRQRHRGMTSLTGAACTGWLQRKELWLQVGAGRSRKVDEAWQVHSTRLGCGAVGSIAEAVWGNCAGDR